MRKLFILGSEPVLQVKRTATMVVGAGGAVYTPTDRNGSFDFEPLIVVKPERVIS